MYYLTKFDDVIWGNFWLIPKPIHDIIKYFFHYMERKGKNNKNLNIFKTKEFFRWNKKHFFIVFEGPSFGERIKN